MTEALRRTNRREESKAALEQGRARLREFVQKEPFLAVALRMLGTAASYATEEANSRWDFPAMEAAAKAEPDGYTLIMGHIGTLAVNPYMFAKLPFDTNRDFAPISLAATAPNILVVHPSLPVKNVKELVALAKAKPGALNYGTTGIGSSPHLAAELFQAMAGVQFVRISYKGAGAALTDLIGGQISMMFGAVPTLMPQVRAGKLRAIAVTTARRSATAPEVPTLIEGGLKEMDIPSWYGAMVPARTPTEVVQAIQREIAAILVLPDVSARLEGQGLTAVANTPQAFAAQIQRETATWARVIREAGIKAE
jgi:tripartite-type tricarboxylate transporter receptor subunit TctC